MISVPESEIAAHVLCCLTHANGGVVANEITSMGSTFAARLVELVATGGGAAQEEGEGGPRETIVAGVKVGVVGRGGCSAQRRISLCIRSHPLPSLCVKEMPMGRW